MADPIPAPGCGRWTPKRKLAVLNALAWGHITQAQAEEFWGLTQAETDHWAERLERFGIDGLSTLKIQIVEQGRARA